MVYPLLLIGHGTRDREGRDAFLEFARVYQQHNTDRPVIPCFLELTEPTIKEGVETCLSKGFSGIVALPLLLFAARHSKFDVTQELDHVRAHYPQVQFHYGRHIGITWAMIDLWRERLAKLDEKISREETVLLFVGRGSSDPDANSDVYKMARLLWEGSGYRALEVCFVGITHPRLEEGLQRTLYYKPKRIIVLPYFLFTGALVKKIFTITDRVRQEAHSQGVEEIISLSEIGIDPTLVRLVAEREQEALQGQVAMNCEMCKFRLAFSAGHAHSDHSHHHHHHHHDHPSQTEEHHNQNNYDIAWQDIYTNPTAYHDRAWQVP